MAPLLDEVLAQDLSIDVEDGSVDGICEQVVELFGQCAQGNFQRADALTSVEDEDLKKQEIVLEEEDSSGASGEEERPRWEALPMVTEKSVKEESKSLASQVKAAAASFSGTVQRRSNSGKGTHTKGSWKKNNY